MMIITSPTFLNILFFLKRRRKKVPCFRAFITLMSFITVMN